VSAVAHLQASVDVQQERQLPSDEQAHFQHLAATGVSAPPDFTYTTNTVNALMLRLSRRLVLKTWTTYLHVAVSFNLASTSFHILGNFK